MPLRHRVLIIDKDDEFKNEQAYLLEAKGYQIISSPSIRKAVDIVFNDPPDLVLVISDIRDGIEAEMLRTLKGGIHCAHIPFIVALPDKMSFSEMDWKEWPVDDFMIKPLNYQELSERMALCFARMQRIFDNNPLTRLPGNTSILRTIQTALDNGEEVAIGYVDIDNFKPYNDRYGFSRGDEVIRMVAMLLTNVLREVEGQRVFVGHVGGDDFVFLLPLTAAEQVCAKIIESFKVLAQNFIDKEDVKTGYILAKDRQGKEQIFPLLSLSVAVLSNEEKRFRYYGAVAEAASQIKKHLKSMDGSNYLIDRRKK